MRFAYIGLGRAAQLYHFPSLDRISGGIAVGAFDQSPEQRLSWQAKTAMPVFSSVEELLALRPEVVVVATPPATHAAMCIAALEAGAHVVCEKPFVETVEEADAVLAAAARADRQVAVNHQFRAKPMFSAVTDGIRSGEYGRLAFCQLWQLMDLAPWEEATAWRAGMARRTLLEGGVHLVDLMLVLFDELPEAVYARHSSGFHEDPEADAVQLLTLEFPGGRLGQITIDRLCRGGTRYFEVRADCERASLRGSLGGRAFLRLGRKRAESGLARLDFGATGLAWVETGLARKVLARSPRGVDTTATGDLLVGMVDAFRNGVEPPSSAREARNVIAVIESAYASAERGARIDLRGKLLVAS
jgi:scyllo-inositol 2-dehydrogenase (NADP+)